MARFHQELGLRGEAPASSAAAVEAAMCRLRRGSFIIGHRDGAVTRNATLANRAQSGKGGRMPDAPQAFERYWGQVQP